MLSHKSAAPIYDSIHQTRPGQQQEDDHPPASRRDRELLERKSYLKNFWYAAGEGAGGIWILGLGVSACVGKGIEG